MRRLRDWLMPNGADAKAHTPETDSRVKLTGIAKVAVHDR